MMCLKTFGRHCISLNTKYYTMVSILSSKSDSIYKFLEKVHCNDEKYTCRDIK